MKEELQSGRVSIFEYKHISWILCLILSKEEDVLFSGGTDSTIVQHSTKTLKPVGKPMKLDIGNLNGIDLNSNLLVVGGVEQFRIIKLQKKTNSGNSQTNQDNIIQLVAYLSSNLRTNYIIYLGQPP